jgi:hypothetical protein
MSSTIVDRVSESGTRRVVDRGSDRAEDVGRLVASCVDRPGIVSTVTSFLHSRGANILQYDRETTSPEGGRFFQRLVFHLRGLAEVLPSLEREFADLVAERFGMTFRVRDAAIPPRVALFVSRYDYCLLDLLWRWRRGESPIDIVQVISHHPDLEPEVAIFGVPYAHIPVTKATKPTASRSSSTCSPAGSTWWFWPGTCRSSPATSCSAWGHRSSTFTIRSCRRSPAPALMTGPRNAA